MKYMLLIYSAPDAGPQWGTPERDLQMKRYFEFSTEVVDKGLFVAGDPLEDTNSATTVRVRSDEIVVTDGRHGGASPDLDATRRNARRMCNPGSPPRMTQSMLSLMRSTVRSLTPSSIWMSGYLA